MLSGSMFCQQFHILYISEILLHKLQNDKQLTYAMYQVVLNFPQQNLLALNVLIAKIYNHDMLERKRSSLKNITILLSAL